MNNVIETINNRVSLRVYKDTPISDEDLNIILNSAIKAPTAGNMMMYSILKIKSDKTKEKLSVTCDNQPFIKNAPLILIFLADVNKWFNYFKVCGVDDIKGPGLNDLILGINDALIAAQNAVIAAESLGIGSCYIGDIMENYEIHKKLLNLPNYTFPACMLTLGYYPDNYQRNFRDRFDSNFVVFDEVYEDLNMDKLKDMFTVKENNMPKTNSCRLKILVSLYIRKKSTLLFLKK